MILQYTGNDEGWYYFFENKEVYDELATKEAYTQPDPAMQARLSERLRKTPEQFEILGAEAGEYFHFRFRYLDEQIQETYLPYRILYYRWDDEGYFYVVGPDVFQGKVISEAGVHEEQTFETIPLAQEKALLSELETSPENFTIIKGTDRDFFYRKFRIKSM